ncbi:unnamed protein product [Polarella glacialis]|uniref:Calmodulin-lysine N-methyltransferase n=1 Tax=Polarella glacialis TaxID=89957 RepID=A0A813FGU0_POLGL|nr:unnamed protein product [Polarella glacialis]
MMRCQDKWPGERSERAKELDMLISKEFGTDSITTWLCPMLMRDELSEVSEALIEELVLARQQEVMLISLDALGSVRVSVAGSTVSEWTMADGRFVWHGARAMVKLIASSEIDVRGKRVLEMGCGLGVVGLACAIAGASSVLLSDHDTELLRACERSAWLNDLQQVIATSRLDWDDSTSSSLLQKDFRPFDVILGADIIYDPKHAISVLGVISRFLDEGFASEAILVTGESDKREGITELDKRLGVDSSELAGMSGAMLCGSFGNLKWTLRHLPKNVEGRWQRFYRFGYEHVL